MHRFGCVWLVFSLLVVPAAAVDIYVNNAAGNDAASGRQPKNLNDMTGPVRTIARALRLAGGGDHIILVKTERPYRESISLVGNRHSGWSDRPFVIHGNSAVLDGSAPVPPEQWKHYEGTVFRFSPPEKGHQQLFLDGRPASRVMVSRLAGSPPKLEPRQWCYHDGHIYFRADKDKLPADYQLTYARLTAGITLYHVEYVTITDLTVQGFQADGIHAANSARQVYLTGVTARGNGRSGVAVGGASVVELDACLLGNNGVAQLLTLPYSETQVRNSRLLPGDTAPGWLDQGGRFYLGSKRLSGGLKEIQPEEETKPGEQPPAKPARPPEDGKPTVQEAHHGP